MSYTSDIRAGRMGRKNAEFLALSKEAREKELLLDSLETRYRRFLKEYPGLADRIPQYPHRLIFRCYWRSTSRLRQNELDINPRLMQLSVMSVIVSAYFRYRFMQAICSLI